MWKKFTYAGFCLLSLSLLAGSETYGQCGSISGLPDTVYIAPGTTYQTVPVLNIGANYTTNSIQWTPTTGVSNPSIINPILSNPGQYILNIIATDTTNLIVNGDFESGNTGFTTSYIISTTTGPGALLDPDRYAINSNPAMVHSYFTYFGDHTTGSGNMMLVNGSPTANTPVWCQTVTVTPNTDYTISYWAASAYSSSPAVIRLTINGTPTAGNLALPPTVGLWTQYQTTWNSGASTTANLCLYDQNLILSGNDFALDDISMHAVCEITDTIVLLQPFTNIDWTYSIVEDCEQDTFHFQATNYGVYDSIVWDLGDGAIGYDTTATHFYQNNGNYTVTMTIYYNGVSYDVTKTINYTQSSNFPSYTVSTESPLCYGDSTGSITIIPSVPSGTWSTSINAGAYNYGKYSYTSLDAGTYIISVKNADGCTTDTSITINQPTALKVGASDFELSCHDAQDAKIIIQVSGGTPGYIIDGDPNAPNPYTLDNLGPGDYSILVEDQNGCEVKTSVTIADIPALEIYVDNEVSPICYQDPNGEFVAYAAGGTPPYVYSVNGGSLTSDPHFTGLTNQTYTVTVTDAKNCTESTEATLYLNCCQPLIPNAFTPNGDGKNDIFSILNPENFSYISLSVFNRWGERIFHGLGDHIRWDGTFHGEPVDVGVYFYLYQVQCGSEKDLTQFPGEVTLLR